MLAALLEHAGELFPLLRRRVLAAKLALAVAPAAVRDHRRDARIDAAGIDRDRAAEARADHRDAVGIDRRILGEEIDGVGDVLDLFEADDTAEIALALAAAAMIEAQRHITVFAEHARRLQHVLRCAVAAKAVQHEKCRPPLAGFCAGRAAHHAMQLEAGGGDADSLFGHRMWSPRSSPRKPGPIRRGLSIIALRSPAVPNNAETSMVHRFRFSRARPFNFIAHASA